MSTNERTTETAIKPCPLCGGNAHVTNIFERRGSFVICAKCGLMLQKSTDPEVVLAWNQRVSGT